MRLMLWVLACVVSCTSAAPHNTQKPADSNPLVISLVGTNDLHGKLWSLPVLAGYLDNLHAVRRAQGGDVLLVDAGDMFQGSLESNLGEGAAIVAAYNQLGFAAAAIGNHEFDFGPEGHTQGPLSKLDPQGALKARAKQAHFPFLSANLIDTQRGKLVRWDNVLPSHVVTRGGMRLGLIGLLTEDTPTCLLPKNFSGLRIAPLAAAVIREAQALRFRKKVDAVVVLSHAGSTCDDLTNPRNLSSCDMNEEIFRVAKQLPEGLVDVIVAGHQHHAIAHLYKKTAIIESLSDGKAFGRVDLVFDRASRKLLYKQIFAPQYICRSQQIPDATCTPYSYEGADVRSSKTIYDVLKPYLARAEQERNRSLGVTVAAEFPQIREKESALGNFLADALHLAVPEAQVVLLNGGGLRSPLPAGPLTYGRLYQVFPFDNLTTLVQLTAQDLKHIVAESLTSQRGIISLAGVQAAAHCDQGQLNIALRTQDGSREIADQTPLLMATTDFVASGGDGLLNGINIQGHARELQDRPNVRDLLAQAIAQHFKTPIHPDRFLRASQPRIQYHGKKPIGCPASTQEAPSLPSH